MNIEVEQRQVLADPHIKLIDLDCEFACGLLSSPPTIAITIIIQPES